MQDGSLSPVKAFLKNKWVRIILIIDVLALLAVIGVIIWNTTKVSTINFNIAPVDATISVNGNTGFTNGQYAITPGTYKITISHENFETKTFTVDVDPHYVVTLAAFLKGTDDNFEFYELKDNHESYEKLESIASKENNVTFDNDASAEQFIADFQKAYQLYQTALPIDYSDRQKTIRADGSPWYTNTTAFILSRNSSDTCQKYLCILASISKLNDDNFIPNLLKEKGFDLKLFEVIYEKQFAQE